MITSWSDRYNLVRGLKLIGYETGRIMRPDMKTIVFAYFLLLYVDIKHYTPNGYIVPMEFRVHFFPRKVLFQDVQKCI